MENKPSNGGDYQFPENPILQTASMVGALVWFCGNDRRGSTHCTGKVLEWVAGTSLDNNARRAQDKTL